MTVLAIIVLVLFAVLIAGPILIGMLGDDRRLFDYWEAVKSSAFLLVAFVGVVGVFAAVAWAVRTLKGEA